MLGTPKCKGQKPPLSLPETKQPEKNSPEELRKICPKWKSLKIFCRKPARACPNFSKKLEKTAHHNPKSAPAFKLFKRKK
jgi:hypothetical protein